MRDHLEAAYRSCWELAHAHYENFSVGSWLLPRHLRRHIAAIYAFARTADDFADEGSFTPAQRLARLDEWEARLHAAFAGAPEGPIFVALAATAERFRIPVDPFLRLLQAFRSDVEFKPFATFEDLREYCRCSADPVGHLILYLFGYADAERQHLSDKICTGLQLTNFWQDVARDAAAGRVYLPTEDLSRFGCSPQDLDLDKLPATWRDLMAFEVERARDHLRAGLDLTAHVDRRLARELSLFAGGGLAVLDKIESAQFDVRDRPTLSRGEKLRLVIRAAAGSVVPRPQSTVTASPRSRQLSDAYAYCRDVTQRSSSNFYYAFRLLSPARREALFAVYAFCRFVDDIADDDSRRDPGALLGRWREELEAVYLGTATHPIGRALADAVVKFALEKQHFLDIIRGVEMDLTRKRYATFDELYEYCYLVASTVGLLCVAIFGARDPSAREYAVDLGIAFQLTNILRDVDEDARRGRIYLPLEDLRRFHCSEEDLLSGRYTPRVGALMTFEHGRASAYYLRARSELVDEDRAVMAAAEAMRMIYERLLGRIAAKHFDVFGERVTLPMYEKLTLALAAWGRSQLAVRA